MNKSISNSKITIFIFTLCLFLFIVSYKLYSAIFFCPCSNFAYIIRIPNDIFIDRSDSIGNGILWDNGIAFRFAFSKKLSFDINITHSWLSLLHRQFFNRYYKINLQSINIDILINFYTFKIYTSLSFFFHIYIYISSGN